MSNNNFDIEFDFERIGLWLKYEADKKIYNFLDKYLENNKNISVENKLIEIINVVSSFYFITNIELLRLYNQKLLEFISSNQE